MTNKEAFDKAVAAGLEFTYFNGEDVCPDAYEDSDAETFWSMEELAATTQDPVRVMDTYKEAVERDRNEQDKDIPPFISESNASDGAKAVAYECYKNLIISSNGYGGVCGWVWTPESNEDKNRGFDTFFRP